MKKNDVFTTKITAYTSEGLGICRINDTVVFVPETAVGDELNVRITKVASNLAYGRKEALITPAQCRIAIDCPSFPRCGGCDFRHISYEEELRFKKQRVADCLQRITGINMEPEEIIGADNIHHYRNKAQFPVQEINGSPEMGFYRERSHSIIPTERCLIQSKDCESIIKALKNWMVHFNVKAYDEVAHTGIIRHLYTRTSTKNGETLVCIVTYGNKLPHKNELIECITSACPSVKGIIQCTNNTHGNRILSDDYTLLWGKDHIYDNIGDLSFKISARSFFQVNTEQAFKLYSKAKEYAELSGGEDVIDLYCGTGTIGLFMADKAKSLYGMEIIPQAIEDAKKNALANGISNATFEVGDAGGFSADKLGVDPDNTVIFVDPPRKGLDEALITTIDEFSPKRLVYISCDPATMARDLKIFIEKGWKVDRCCAVDMFPRTRHVESLVCLTRQTN